MSEIIYQFLFPHSCSKLTCLASYFEVAFNYPVTRIFFSLKFSHSLFYSTIFHPERIQLKHIFQIHSSIFTIINFVTWPQKPFDFHNDRNQTSGLTTIRQHNLQHLLGEVKRSSDTKCASCVSMPPPWSGTWIYVIMWRHLLKTCLKFPIIHLSHSQSLRN